MSSLCRNNFDSCFPVVKSDAISNSLIPISNLFLYQRNSITGLHFHSSCNDGHVLPSVNASSVLDSVLHYQGCLFFGHSLYRTLFCSSLLEFLSTCNYNPEYSVKYKSKISHHLTNLLNLELQVTTSTSLHRETTHIHLPCWSMFHFIEKWKIYCALFFLFLEQYMYINFYKK